MPGKRSFAAASWSGGKDNCLACYKALKQGFSIKYLLNLISKESKRCCFHGIESELLKLQAKAIGIKLIQCEVSPDMQEYEKEFKQAVSNIKDIEYMVFGDIYLSEHKEWVERVCRDIGIKQVEPLWNQSAADVIGEFIDLGFKAKIVSCQANLFDRDFVGRTIDKDFLREMKSRNICPCGENGEFHTFVTDGPFFRKRIEFMETETVIKQGFWRYWFLDIKKYRMINKK